MEGLREDIHGTDTKPWRLEKWNGYFSKDKDLPPMSQVEIEESIRFLRDHMYPKPEDCPGLDCPKVRPACHLNIC